MFIQVRDGSQIVTTIRVLDGDVTITEDGATYVVLGADAVLEAGVMIITDRAAVFEPAPQEQLKSEADREADASAGATATGEATGE